MKKGQLREQVLKKLKKQREDVKRRRSKAIWRKVFRLTAFRQAKTVCCYVSLPYEVQTWQMIEAMIAKDKRVVVPVVREGSTRLALSEIRVPKKDLQPGPFGVHQPKPNRRRSVRVKDVDFVLVPGLAFDRRGHRLGHGKGYYDRFLAKLPKTVPTVGLAFRFQLFDSLPTSAHDHAVSSVLTA